MGIGFLFSAAITVLWIVRELMGYRQRLEYEHLRQRYHILDAEWNASRKEVAHLREMNGHMQSMFKEQSAALLDSRKDIESRLQGVCSQTLIGAQKTFLAHLQPILSQFQQSTTGQLKEQSSFLTQLVSPLEHYLHDMKQHIHSLEQTRVGAYSGLKEQIGHLAEGQKVLSTETNALMNAFRTPHIRGCWGEMQLRRVVELAGMVAYCDFQQHPTLATEKRHGVRPDMIIRLPGKKSIIVDAKAPMTHYLESTSAKTSAEYQSKIKEHARVLGTHIKALSDKKYWSYQEHAVELTVLFLPGEAFLSAALEGDANLLELAAQKNIILATPILCIALLKTIAQGWRQDLFSQKTHRIIAMSQDLSTRLEKFHGHLLAVGKALKNGQLAYQSAIGVFEETIVPTVQQLGSIVPDQEESDSVESRLQKRLQKTSSAPSTMAPEPSASLGTQWLDSEKDGSDKPTEVNASADEQSEGNAVWNHENTTTSFQKDNPYTEDQNWAGQNFLVQEQDVLDVHNFEDTDTIEALKKSEENLLPQENLEHPIIDFSNSDQNTTTCPITSESVISSSIPVEWSDNRTDSQDFLTESKDKSKEQNCDNVLNKSKENSLESQNAAIEKYVYKAKPWVQNNTTSDASFFNILSEKDRAGISIELQEIEDSSSK